MNIPKWKVDLATKYGVTVEDITREDMVFLQSEGYLNDGTECDTLDIWCAKRLGGRAPREPFEPHQKGDETPI